MLPRARGPASAVTSGTRDGLPNVPLRHGPLGPGPAGAAGRAYTPDSWGPGATGAPSAGPPGATERAAVQEPAMELVPRTLISIGLLLLAGLATDSLGRCSRLPRVTLLLLLGLVAGQR